MEKKRSQKTLKNFSFATWNIDGLHKVNIKERTMAVISTIQERNLDIVFLQEVVSESYDLLSSHLSSAYLLTDNKANVSEEQYYFTAILLKRETLWVKNITHIPFDNSGMGRDLSVVDAKFVNGAKIVLMNSHLESMKQFAKERMEQLKTAFDMVSDEDENSTVVFAGDLNIRDSEVDKVGIPDRVADLWTLLGEPKEYQFTWDLTINTNMKPFDNRPPRFRFDRVYFRPSAKNNINPKYFRFCGTKKVPGWKCFPSDHFGILCNFEFGEYTL